MRRRALILTAVAIIVLATFTAHTMTRAAERDRTALLPLFQSSINPPATIGGMVFNDLNRNSSQDAGELGIADVTVELLQRGSVIDTTTTDPDGIYRFERGFTGEYTVKETDPEGHTSTTPNEVTVRITRPGQLVIANFGDQIAIYLPIALNNYPK